MIISLVLFALVIWLQFYLSKKKSKWVGLVMPICIFLTSVMVVISFLAMGIDYLDSSGSMQSYEEDIIIQSPESIAEIPKDTKILMYAFPIFGIINIPTLIFLVVYLITRKICRPQ